jgi:hypothetical protein
MNSRIEEVVEIDGKSTLCFVMQQFSVPMEFLNDAFDLLKIKWKELVMDKWTEKMLHVHCVISVYLVAKSRGIFIGIKKIKEYLGKDFGYFSRTLLRYNYTNVSAWRNENIRKIILNSDRDSQVKELALILIEAFPKIIMNSSETIAAATALIAASTLLHPNKKPGTVALSKKFGIASTTITERTKLIYKKIDKMVLEKYNDRTPEDLDYFDLLQTHVQNQSRDQDPANIFHDIIKKPNYIDKELKSKIHSFVNEQLKA